MRRPCTRLFLTCTTRRWIRLRHSVDHRSFFGIMRSTARLSNGVMRLSDERPPLNKRAFFRSPRRCAFCCSTGFVRLAVPRSGLRASLSRSACSYTRRFNRARACAICSSDRAWACAICRFNRARDPFRIRMWQLFSFSWRLSAFRKIGDGKMPGHKPIA